MKETYNYEASEGMILLGVPADLRQLDYASAADMAVIEQAVIAGDDKPDLTPRCFNAEFKEYAEITLSSASAIMSAWQAEHPEPEVSPDETGETPDGKGEESSPDPANEGKEAEV